MAVCALAPSAESRLTERLEWLTAALPSKNGKEQRIRLRGHPRRRLDFDFALGSDADRARAENFLAAHHGSVVDLPLWPHATVLGVALSAAAVSIPLTTANRFYTVGGKVALVNGLDAEVATISAVNASSLTVSALANAWPVGSFVAPAETARMDARINSSNPWPAVLKGRVQFLCEDGWAIAAAVEAADYLGYPVRIPDASQWALDGSTEFERPLGVFDPQVGKRAVYDDTGVEFPARQHRVALAARADLADFYAFLAARAGRQNPIWLASGQKDLSVTATIGSAATTIQVGNTGYVALKNAVGGIPVGRRDIVIEAVSGQKYYRRITNAAGTTGDETLTLDSALGATLAVADIARVSFMRLARLANDGIEIAHHWDGAAEAKLAFMALREDA